MKPTRLSIQHCNFASQQGSEYTDAYIFVRKLHSLVKHPILFNLKANRDAIRLQLGYTDKKFRETLNCAIRLNLASYKGNDLIFLSNNRDRSLSSRTRFIKTNTPDLTFKEIIIRSYYYRQKAKLSHKEKQTPLSKASISDFIYQKQVAPQTYQIINRDITLSCRKVANLLNCNSSAQGFNIKKELKEAGLINLYPNKVELQKNQAIALIKKGHHNIRRNEDKWFYILADTFDMGNKRKQSYCKQRTLYTDI